MGKKRLAFVALTITLIFGIAWFFGFNSTGFVALPTAQNTPNEPAEQSTSTGQKANAENTITSVRSVSAGLSLEEVRPTELDATISEGKTVACPQTGEITIKVKNTGKNTAERLKSFFQEFAVKECENCSAKQIAPREEISVKVTGCAEQDSTPFAQFWALNAEKKTVFLD
ncbi:MAG: hypothetical protein Q7K34_01330 [archaeon]|nr:hypothetical protein [archaeon]